MFGHGWRLGRLLEGKSEHYVKTERTVRATIENSIRTQIPKCHVCVHRMRCLLQKQVLCELTVLAGGVRRT